MSRIDVHHHLVAPKYIAQLRELGTLTPHLASIMNDKDAITDMDKAGVSLAVNSATLPEQIQGAARVAFSRDNNEYMTRLVGDYPGRFGTFANLPLPDIDATLKEIEYAFDVLKVDGVHMITSYGDHWLGDKIFAPVFDELNRRKAVIYTHPHGPHCTQNILKDIDIRDSSIEYGTDTTRALVNLLFGGTFSRCPDIKIIFSHGGGTMPFLVERFIRMEKMPRYAPLMPNGFVAEAKKFFYDTAQVLHGSPLLALKHLIPLAQICYGTDYPWRYSDECVNGLLKSGAFTADELRTIDNNAAPLLPRFTG
jgi:predicted TIM-barrel fold metal-dependent hydrolase